MPLEMDASTDDGRHVIRQVSLDRGEIALGVKLGTDLCPIMDGASTAVGRHFINSIDSGVAFKFTAKHH